MKLLILVLAIFLTNLSAMNHHHHNMKDNHQHIETKKEYNSHDIDLAKKGKKIFETLCDEDKFKEFNSKDEAREFIAKNCQSLNEDRLNALSTYLYLPNLANEKNQMIDVPQNAKCPVCGMFVAKYEKWATKIDTSSKVFYFDGVIDMMKFYFEPSKYEKNLILDENVKISVTNYYTLEEIDAKTAFYVTNSNVFGPMGKELIPFKNEKQAIEFSKEHFGEKVLRFDEITKDDLKR